MWEHTLALEPNSYSANDNLAWAKYEVGDFAGAIQLYQKAVNLVGGRLADPWIGAALAFEALGQTANADVAFARAVQVDSDWTNLDRCFRRMLINRKHSAKLQPIVDRYLTSHPRNAATPGG
jgi:tetratricopeptide (TPR) repeat protein